MAPNSMADFPTLGDTDHHMVDDIGSYLDNQTLEIDPDLDSDPLTVPELLNSSSSARASSSQYEAIEENGRKYHLYKEGKYPLPIDEPEQDRLDLQHKIYTLALDGRLYANPLPENTRNVLDVATGTGIWAIDFAQQHPETHVTGTDLTLIQTKEAPPNVSFKVHDAEDEWSFPTPFDFIHFRAVATCFKDPRSVLASARDSLAPGGYIQLRDPIMPFKFYTPPPENCALAQWNAYIREASAKVGRRWDNAQHYAAWLRELGFVDVVEHREMTPLSPWTKDRRKKYIGLWVQHDMISALEGLSMALFTRVLGWDKDRLSEFLERVKKDMRDTSLHAYAEGVLVWGRKPREGETVEESK